MRRVIVQIKRDRRRILIGTLTARRGHEPGESLRQTQLLLAGATSTFAAALHRVEPTNDLVKAITEFVALV
jgi:hypothetical protein